MSGDKKALYVTPIPLGAAPPDAEPYKVGYGKPPREHRFKPGESGNRAGRRRRSKSMAAVFDEMFSSTVTLTVDGKRRKMTVREMMALRAKKDLASGSVRSIERWLAYAEKVEPRTSEDDAPQIDYGSLTTEQLRVLASIRLTK